MRIQFSGDFAELNKFADKVSETPHVLVTVSEQLAEETIDLIREGFEQQRDPFGRKWKEHAPLTQLVRPGGRILEDSGGLKAAWHRVSATGKQFQVGNAKKYAWWMQRGTGIYGPRKRRIVPVNAKVLRIPIKAGGAVKVHSVKGAPPRRMTPARKLPPKWAARYVDTAQEVLTELFR